MHLKEIPRLKQIKVQKDEVLEQEMGKRVTLAESLSQMANLNEAELRSQAFIGAAEERKSRLATLEERIKSYETQS